jgi:2-iminobutanoate/2-iminopropanoate deaminase
MAGDVDFVELQGMAAPGGHYSHAVRAGAFVFVSGQLPISANGARLADKDFQTQVRQALANLATVLEAANSAVNKLIHVRVYVTDINDWPVFDKLYSEWIGAARPARAVVPVPTLHYGFRVEIEAVAGVVQ